MASTKLTAIRIALIAACAAASLITNPTTPTFANTTNAVIPLKYKTISEKNDGQKYEINVDYPYLESSDTSSLSFNQTAEKIATENVAAFKESLSPPVADQSSGLEVTYDVLRSDSEYISVRFGVSAYLAGMAHPSYASRVLNWDVRNGKALVLDDVFKPKSGYLRTVANYCTSLLRKQKKLDFPTGAQPKDLNYVNWNININKGLLISYDPYQVGPWAAGRIECQVPLKTLSRILKEPKRWALQ
jgi:Protein of unknown function (DUF3298)